MIASKSSIKLTIAIALLGIVSTTANAASEHSTKFECYANVHDGCFLTEPPCSNEVYNEFLDMCDTAYPNGGAVPRKPASLSSQGQGTQNTAAYRQKIQKIKRSLKQRRAK